MKLIREVEAFYPAFHLGHEPQAIPCRLSIVEANDRRYFKTPFAFLNAYSDDEPERAIASGGYYADESSCQAYLDYQYPNWQAAAPIMEALADACHYSAITGAARIADKCQVSTDTIYKLARGQRGFTLKQVRAAAKLLARVDSIA